jgi:hypothetical protein
MFDSATFIANAGNNLQKAQMKLEEVIKEYANAADLEAEATRAYREAVAEGIAKAREASIQVSVMSDLVKGQCADLKETMMKATAHKKQIQFYINAYESRIVNIRHLSKGIDQQIRTQ